MKKIYDLYNKEVKVGDRVAIGRDTNVDSCYLVTGTVIDIKYCEVQTIATIKVDKQGCWNNDFDEKSPRWYDTVTYKIPRYHCNIVVL